MNKFKRRLTKNNKLNHLIEKLVVCLRFVVLSVIAAHSVTLHAKDDEFLSIDLLSKMREQITFPTYSEEEKLQLATQVKLFMESYVNHTTMTKSIEDFEQNQNKLSEIVELSRRLNDAELHQQINQAFLAFKDWHLSYILPKPYQCYQSSQLFDIEADFHQYTPGDDFRSPSYFISRILQQYAYLSPAIAQLKLGDKVIAIDGISITSYLSELSASLPNYAHQDWIANPKRFEMQLLTYRNHRNLFLPEKNTTTYTILRSKLPDDGLSPLEPVEPESISYHPWWELSDLDLPDLDVEMFEIEVPWVTFANTDCLSGDDAQTMAITDTNSSPDTVNSAFEIADGKALVDYQQIYGEHFGQVFLGNSDGELQTGDNVLGNNDAVSTLTVKEPILVVPLGEMHASGSTLESYKIHSEEGIMLSTINPSSELGAELKISSVDNAPSYVVHYKNFSTEIEGKTVTPNYSSLMDNRADAESDLFNGKASDTTKMLGSILHKVDQIIGTENDDHFYG
ncbi:MAG: hypothetical protein AAGB12_16330, partial [Pseudomonadota bacterium]